MYEIIRMKGSDVSSKLYTEKTKFLADFQIFAKKGIPCKAQGVSKTGEIASITRNGWNDDDVILTAVVDFGNGRKYSYQAGKRYSGQYEVLTRYGQSIVTVSYAWRQIDDFRAEMWNLGYDEPVMFESILVRKVVSK